MTNRTFIAPGKVVLLGEYAVLDGAPAIVAAVDRGVVCSVSESMDGCIIDAPDERFVGPSLAPWRRPGRYVFTPHNPTNTATKVGLGGSASATVVATLAGSTWNSSPLSGHDLYESAYRTHKLVQGSGSGIDIAASVFGGVLRFEGGKISALSDVAFHLIWSGGSASTGPRVQQYMTWAHRTAFVRESSALVDAFQNEPISTLRAANDLLTDMARLAKIDYQTPALQRIAELAVKHNGAAKPSGAGGGDCAIACFPSTIDPSGFLAECAREGYQSIQVSLSRGAHERAPCPT